MSRYFMYGTSLQKSEQMMMSVPNFLPRTKGMFIIGQKTIDEKEEFKRCIYCSEYSKGGCRRLQCPYLLERADFGQIGYADFIKDSFWDSDDFFFKKRLRGLCRSFTGEWFMSSYHKDRYLCLAQGSALLQSTKKQNLASWYWAVPYIAALLIMRNLSPKANRTYVLYVAIAMIGFSFIAFLLLGRSWADYLVVNTLMLGACGVYDLFWWSILGEMLELDKNPAKIMGVGLSANVLGVLLGGLIGNAIASTSGQSHNPTLFALGVVCVTLVLLPPLHKRLTALLKNHVFLTTITEMPVQEQTRLICAFGITEKLTEREGEIAVLLIKGKTYRMIAGELHVSENTVKTHVKNIYAKAGVQSRTELMHLLLDTHTPHTGSP